jgi:hypothetical protein
MPGLDITSFCDIGAYDGDSLRATKTVFPQLRRSFTLEPNPELEAQISESATRLGIDNSHFVGGAWDYDTRLAAHEAINGTPKARSPPSPSTICSVTRPSISSRWTSRAPRPG